MYIYPLKIKNIVLYCIVKSKGDSMCHVYPVEEGLALREKKWTLKGIFVKIQDLRLKLVFL